MIVPIRCFSCGKVIAGKQAEFKERIEKHEDPGKVLDSLGLKKYCCRKTILTHVELVEDIMKYQK